MAAGGNPTGKASPSAWHASLPRISGQSQGGGSRSAATSSHRPTKPSQDRAADIAGSTGEGIGLYVHVPFCKSKCAYCAFSSQPLTDMAMVEAYAAHVSAEAALWGKRLGRQRISTVYVGGGTPSLLPDWAWDSLWKALHASFHIPQDIEISIEANPDSAHVSTLRQLASMGVNRLSLGVQSLVDTDLAFLGRAHNAAQAVQALEDALTVFGNVSVDLIWGLPGQKVSAWLATVRRVAAMGLQHLSCYGLTVEPNTPLDAQQIAGELALPQERDLAAMYMTSAETLEGCGFMQYEISNFARMGYSCAHNQAYWQGRDYLGLGPAAVSTLHGQRWTNPADPAAYGRMVSARALAPGAEPLDQPTRLREAVMLALRTSVGLDLKAHRLAGGRDLLADGAPLVTLLCNKGLAKLTRGRLALTRRGMLVSNAIIARVMDAA